MTEHSVVTAVDDRGQRVLVHTPWGYTVAVVHSGTLGVGARLEGMEHELGVQHCRDAATGAAIEVEVLVPPSERAVAEKMFIGN
ncbi:MAG TPA: hypothetical protein VFG55_06230 [Rhodanobacteraceae bacterium]|nr:hypothetical protein [Rhodanobacteraceae bacterium]